MAVHSLAQGYRIICTKSLPVKDIDTPLKIYPSNILVQSDFLHVCQRRDCKDVIGAELVDPSLDIQWSEGSFFTLEVSAAIVAATYIAMRDLSEHRQPFGSTGTD